MSMKRMMLAIAAIMCCFAYADNAAAGKTTPGNGLYLVVDLSGGTNAVSYPVSYLGAVPNGGWTNEHKTTKLVLRRIDPGSYTMGCSVSEKGYTGGELAEHLRGKGIEPEYADRLYTVLMPTPYNRPGDLEAVTSALEALPDKGAPLLSDDPEISVPKKAVSPREAYFRPFRRIPVEEALGKVCARTAMSCQPSIPVIAGGEVFDEKIIKILKNYGIFRADVVE